MNVFEPGLINDMEVANRFVRSATHEGLATEKGACTAGIVEVMAELARGKIGLLITSHAYVHPKGQAGKRQLGIYADALVDDLRPLPQAVHQEGSRVILQISHSGILANSKYTGHPPMAVSSIEGFSKTEPKEMRAEEIKEVVAAFGEAAGRAKEAGFDGIQIHAAHGYLMSQFLSPAFNKRTDAYGGSVTNRMRALLEVVGCVREEVGKDFTLLIKMNCEDALDGGLTLDESLKIGLMLQDSGVDAIELSGGTLVSGDLLPFRKGILSEEKEAYFREAARVFKKQLRIPLILVGGIRTPQLAEQLLEEGYCDFISMSRPFIREPHLVKRWISGDLVKATCLSDNKCLRPIVTGEGLYCVVDREKKEKTS